MPAGLLDIPACYTGGCVADNRASVEGRKVEPMSVREIVFAFLRERGGQAPLREIHDRVEEMAPSLEMSARRAEVLRMHLRREIRIGPYNVVTLRDGAKVD